MRCVGTKSEAILEFHANDECPVQLTEMRLHIPQDPDRDRDNEDPVEVKICINNHKFVPNGNVMYRTQLILEARNVAGFWDFDEVLGVSITPSLLNATIVLLHFHNFIYSFRKFLQVHSLPKSYIVCFLVIS